MPHNIKFIARNLPLHGINVQPYNRGPSKDSSGLVSVACSTKGLR